MTLHDLRDDQVRVIEGDIMSQTTMWITFIMASQLHRAGIKIFCEGKQIVHSLSALRLNYICAVLYSVIFLAFFSRFMWRVRVLG